MQFKLIFVILNLLSSLAFAEETNLFQVNYLTQSNDSLHSLQKKPDTKIYAGMNKEKDNISRTPSFIHNSSGSFLGIF